MPETAPLLDAALRGALVACLVLLAALLRPAQARSEAARLGVWLALALAVQTVGAAPAFEAGVPALWQAPVVAVSVGNAVLFWLFVMALFDDDFRLQRWHLALWAAVAGLALVNCLWGWQSPHPLARVSTGLQRALPLVFAVLSLVAATRHWQADLVEARRRLRGFVVVTGVAYTVAQFSVRLASPSGQLSPLAALADVSCLLAMAVGVVAHLLRGDVAVLLPTRPSAPTLPGPPAPAPNASPTATSPVRPASAGSPELSETAEALLAEQLLARMRSERLYRDETLTLARLAEQVGVPEYRLRRVINQHLGHRNFNAFVNGFRLAEVQAALADPARRDLPVLTLALDAGFGSIGPFNRAFKAATGQTPTEYRRGQLGEAPVGGVLLADS